jgi:AGZA family xanthine/uracil permease-like MFS transporter
MLERLFSIGARGSTPRREVLAGATTFLTMAYIVIVNPQIMAAAGIDRAPPSSPPASLPPSARR